MGNFVFHFVFKILGLFVLALAVVLAVLDITRSITASEILGETWEETRAGKGVCVGRPLPSITGSRLYGL